jgi:CDP-glucose 4,6-dehydratase
MRSFYAEKRVLVTGHTGFKGGWLAVWLNELGAKVSGYALEPATTPSFFEEARVAEVCDDARGDVRDLDRVVKRVDETKPEIVFHLAAQPIVRASYDDPVGTFTTNVTGTAHVLEAVRRRNAPCLVVVVTSDKCYENTGSEYAYRETDPLGGSDPYSASKACAEIVTSAYARSFFAKGDVRVASARAGNVIGGGDYAADRLIPDLVRSIKKKEPLTLRNPQSVRPWQHVLEPLAGYLWLAHRLGESRDFAGAWNFGPAAEGFRTVHEIATRATKVLEGHPIVIGKTDEAKKEAPFLTLSTDKTRRRLGWSAVWENDRGVDETMEWYRAVSAGEDARAVTLRQIRAYAEEISWTKVNA